MNSRFLALALAALVMAAAAVGCAAAAREAAPEDTVTVFAASSLAEPFPRRGGRF